MMNKLFAVASLALFAGSALAQAFPEREVRVITGFPPGSVAELALRALVRSAQKHVDKPLLVINKPGGGQSIAMQELMNAPPDGYTVGMVTDTFPGMTYYQYKLKFEAEDIQPLVGFAQFRHVLFVKGDSPLRKYEEFVAAAKRAPVSYGGTGRGTTPDMLGKIFARAAGLNLEYVAFKGSNEYVPSVMGGHVASGIVDISGVAKHIEDGSLAGVVVFGDERLAEFPNIPTVAEKGVNVDMSPFNSVITIVANRKAPAERTRVLQEAFTKAANDPEFKAAAKGQGVHAVSFGPDVIKRRIDGARQLAVPLMKEMDLIAK
ncbi:tripartite tricarboxylate transporter substrate binding protein [Ramlibacter henchirensis]|uniref:Tripartite tricarboxylate transporter substrate binding protein n=1 Tax=Ramlibacter henchirensis TaxID=204072 RepID=A0A4Z0BXD9_9BURK|nr:tripartite tricarboxylate transporter substrate binding protein [Ramlibacter henchirensis]TFZ02639.1 tripartite tricarboxylate transporter substrate binding protein [Ramlibacter henchirensis]